MTGGLISVACRRTPWDMVPPSRTLRNFIHPQNESYADTVVLIMASELSSDPRINSFTLFGAKFHGSLDNALAQLVVYLA